MLGREREFADQVVRALILNEPTLLGSRDELTRSAPLCVAASPELGQRCIARLRTLMETGYFRNPTAITEIILQAAAFCVAGELERAAGLLRPLSTTEVVREPTLAWLLVHVLDAVGSADLADEVDRAVAGKFGEFNGASLADVRRARRHAQDDPQLARQLASKVSSAWRTADVIPPVLQEMRALAVP